MFLPLKQIDVSQYYGHTSFAQENKEWYKDGIHYGIDFRCPVGTKIYASIAGVANKYYSESGGNVLEIVNGKEKIVLCHLSDIVVDNNSKIKQGQMVASSGSSGKFCTGPHLHLGYKNQEYRNPACLFDACFDGTPIKNKDWERSYCYHRYGRKREWLAEFNIRFKNAWLTKHLKKDLNILIPTDEMTNALVYGAWDYQTVINPAMYQYWSNLTKNEYTKAYVSNKK